MKKDTGQADEHSMIANAKIEDVFKKVVAKIDELNKKLIDIRDKIKESQKDQSPKIVLELFGCGKKCSGCPHTRWVLFELKKNKDDKLFPKGIYLGKKERDPILNLPRKSINCVETMRLIREAKAVILERKTLLESIRVLGSKVTKKELTREKNV